MGLEEVKKQLLEEAQKKAQEIASDASAEANRIIMEADKEVRQYEKELRANAEKMLEAQERKELAAAEFDGRRVTLDMKKEMIERVIEEAKKELKKLPAEQRKKLIARLLEKANEEIAVKKVYLNSKDKSYVKEKGIVVKEKEMTGGLIAETGDGRISVDYSFEEKLSEIKEAYLQELSEVLFGG